MATVYAYIYPDGLISRLPPTHHAEREITSDLPDTVIGECVGDAVQQAWKAGHDPAMPDFCVVVEFS